jgi:hypothetical protein
MATQTRVQTQDLAVRTNHFTVYLSKDGFEAYGHNAKGEQIYKLWASADEAKEALKGFVLADAPFRTAPSRNGNRSNLETYVDGTIPAKGRTWEVSFHVNAAAALYFDMDRRVSNRRLSTFDLDEANAELTEQALEAEIV